MLMDDNPHSFPPENSVLFSIEFEGKVNIPLDTKSVCEVLFKSAAEGLAVVCGNGLIHMVNPRLKEMFGFAEEELIGQEIELLVPDALKNRHVWHRERYAAQPVRRPMGRNLDLKGRRKNGSSFPVEVSLNHFEWEGKVMIMALISDISERKKSEARTRLHARIVEHIQFGIMVFHLEEPDDPHSLRLIAFNPAAEQLTGLKEAEVLGCYMDEVYINMREQPKKASEILAEIARFGGEKSFDNFIYGDARIPEKAWSVKVFNLPGNCAGVSFEDVSQRKKAEFELKEWNRKLEQRVKERTQALLDSQRLYKMIARNFPNGVINVLDRDLNYVFVEGMKMYKRGITGDLLVGSSFLERLNPALRSNIETRLKGVFEGQNSSFEMKVGKSTYLMSAVGMQDADHQINQILIVSQDITSLKKAEEDIQQALVKEKQLNELKFRFVAMASHEFRTPLTTVMNSISLLSKYVGSDQHSEKQFLHINRIKASIHDLTNILNDFLSFDKLEEGKVEMHLSRFNLPVFSEELIQDLSGIAKKGQHIRYKHFGPAVVQLDKQMLRSIYNNLISNALKYSPEDKPIALETSVNKKQLTITVTDQGIGIPEEEQKHLFERFFRAHNAVNIQGTGLGLNIVKKYVEMAKGEIDFKSATGKGTHFTIKIPLEQKEIMIKE